SRRPGTWSSPARTCTARRARWLLPEGLPEGLAGRLAGGENPQLPEAPLEVSGETLKAASRRLPAHHHHAVHACGTRSKVAPSRPDSALQPVSLDRGTHPAGHNQSQPWIPSSVPLPYVHYQPSRPTAA